ncbi:MAG: N-acetylglucosamine-6-phosphate deacetylase [Candidatus Asgardarchaeia archaeon]
MGKKDLVIKNANVITPFLFIENGCVVVEDGKISEVGKMGEVSIPRGVDVIDAKGKYLAPGFIDVHTHGGMGKSFRFVKSKEDVDTITKFFARNGTTGCLATVTAPLFIEGKDVGTPVCRKLGEFVRKGGNEGCQILGIHLEGPYFSTEKPGAAAAKTFRKPNLDEVDEVVKASGNTIKIIDVAPELDGAIEFIRGLVERGIIAAIGHTHGTYEDVLRGIENGATHIIHAYNAMTEFHHRHPGVVGAMLTRDDVNAELIADGVHVHPAAMKVLLRCKGTDRIDLITDSTAPAGLPNGEYEFIGRKVIVKDGVCFLPRPPISSALAGTKREEKVTLAGSMATMNKDVRNIVKLVGTSLCDAVKMASHNPAKELGIADRKGSIKPGKDADLVIFDDDVNVLKTIIGGEVVYSSEG